VTDIMAGNIERMKAIIAAGPKGLSDEDRDFLWLKFGYLDDEELRRFESVLPKSSDPQVVDEFRRIMQIEMPARLARDPGLPERLKKDLDLRTQFQTG